MVLWTVDSFEIQKLCLLVGLVSSTSGYIMGKFSQAQIISFLKFIFETKEVKS
ncbi:hypothetical protein [Methanosarcina sp. 1.H.A.2.2]|uniref:hypothetical protein n=1 Tax=Methanosarcina sp. 1.H.A.2.2 TaxID=1483601 RepID=UPI000AAE9CD3|nr:hypothetical protein [Methanosarcina sp. 1.H.A.2.2]